MTGTECPSALRRCLRSIPDPVLKVDVKNDATSILEIEVVFKCLRGGKEHGIVPVCAKEPLHTHKHATVVIDDKDDIWIWQE